MSFGYFLRHSRRGRLVLYAWLGFLVPFLVLTWLGGPAVLVSVAYFGFVIGTVAGGWSAYADGLDSGIRLVGEAVEHGFKHWTDDRRQQAPFN